MATQGLTDGDDADDLAGAPTIRTFQVDTNGIGALKSSVNMFRGAVNFPLNLLSIPARNGLAMDVTAFYSSTVRSAVKTWNL